MKLGLGLGIGAGGGGASPSTLAQLQSLLAGTNSFIYDPTDISSLFQDSAGTTPVTSDSDPVGRVADLSGNGFNALQPTTANKPAYRSATQDIEYDGVDDFMETAATSSANMSLILSVNTSDTQGILFSNGGTRFVGFFRDVSGSATFGGSGTPTTYVDDVLVATQDAFHDALTGSVNRRVDIRNADMSLWTEIEICRISTASFNVAGRLKRIVGIDNASLTAPQQAEALALAQAFIDEGNA